MNHRVAHRQRRPRKNLLFHRRITRPPRLHRQRIELSPTPIENKHRLLILRGKLRPISKCHPRRRSRPHINHRRQVVAVPLRPLSRPVPPTKLRPAHHMTNPSRPIPRSVKVPFHIRVPSKQLPVPVKRRIKNIPKARSIKIPLLPIGRNPVNRSPRRQNLPHKSPTIWHPRQQMVLPENPRNTRLIRCQCLRPISTNQKDRLPIRRQNNRVHPMIPTRSDVAKLFYLV